MNEEIKLKRELGLFEATLAGIGIILGAGIYALVGKAAGLAGNALWLSFLISALVASFTGLSYAELSSIFPKAGAEYTYTLKAFGRSLAFLVGWLIIISGVISSATVALGFGGYFNAIFNAPIVPVAIILIIILSFIIFYGIKESTWFAIIFTLIEASGLFIIIAVGLPYLGSVNYLEVPSLGGLLGASALIFFAFIGFEEMVRLSEETKDPTKNIPRALIIAIVVTAVIYVLVGISSVSVVNWQALGASSAPLSDVASAALGGQSSLLLSVIALFATANTVLLMLLAASRITYGMAKSFAVPDIFGRVHSKRRTPWVSIFFLAAVTVLFILPSNIETVANLTNFTVFATFIAINITLIYLRYTQPDLERPFKVPLNVGRFPVIAGLGLVTSIILMMYMGIDILIYGLALIILGVVVHRILLYF